VLAHAERFDLAARNQARDTVSTQRRDNAADAIEAALDPLAPAKLAKLPHVGDDIPVSPGIARGRGLDSQIARAGTFGIVSIDWIVLTASRKENATAWTEVARAISSAGTSLFTDPQNPTTTRARGARRRMRLTRKRARAGELVLISDRHTTAASLKSGK